MLLLYSFMTIMEVANSFGILVVSSIMLARGCTSIFILSSGRLGSCGTIPLMEIDPCVSIFAVAFSFDREQHLESTFLLLPGPMVYLLAIHL